MVEKIEVGKKYRVGMSKVKRKEIRTDIEKYSDNGVILLSNIITVDFGRWKFKRDNGEEGWYYFTKEQLLPVREEAFLEIFKEEIYD